MVETDFGWALRRMRLGDKLYREGWNGKNQYIVLKPGYMDGISCNDATAKAHNLPVGTTIFYSPYIEMKTSDGVLVPWLASQTDILAMDWEVF